LPADKIDLYWKQADKYDEEFYFLVMNHLFNKSQKDENYKTKLDKLIIDLNLDFEEKKLKLSEYKP
jgi:hypothetical protein